MKLTLQQEDNEIQLSEDLLKIAKNELREDKGTREQCLEQFRAWLLKNEDIINMRMDDTFLLRFLRAKKYSIPMAEQTLLKYLNVKRTFPQYTTELNLLDPTVRDVLDSGYIFATPQRDRHGRRVIIINAKAFNPKLWSSTDQARAHFITYEYLMEDPITQIVGVTHVGDFAGVTTSHVTNWNPTDFARLFKWAEQSYPLRHKEIHLINVPSTLKWLIDFVKNRVSNKIRQRLSVYTSDKELFKATDVDCLPQEMGGKMPLKEMVQLWKQELQKKQDILLQLDEMRLLSDRGIQRKSSYNSEKASNQQNTFVSQIESIQGSFRKLEFD